MADLSQLSDEQLGVYRDLVAKKQPATAPATPPPAIPPNAGIAPAPTPQGLGGKLSQWAGDAADDLRLGSGRTLPGRILQSVHATPLNEGVSPATANYMGSPALGTLRAVRGLGQTATPGQRVEGLKNIGGGILDAAQMPLSLVAPEASAQAVDKGIDMIPNMERAGKSFEAVMSKAKDVPVDLSRASDPALRAQELRESGASMPGVVNKFLQRTTTPGLDPLTYERARDFASNAGRLSADEKARMIPPMKAQVARLAQTLNEANAGAADKVGMLPQYTDAMNEYRRAAKLRDFKEGTVNLLKGPVAKAALGGIGAGAGYTAYKTLHQ